MPQHRRSVQVDPSLVLEFTPYPRSTGTGRHNGNSEHWGPEAGDHPRNSSHVSSAASWTAPRTREQFVGANYAFGVCPERAVLSLEDPDIPVDWSAVDVVFESSSASDCPICLHPLRAPRITKCGHIFDHVCALQHLHHASDNSGAARCPLCSVKMRAEDLRRVDFRRQLPIKEAKPEPQQRQRKKGQSKTKAASETDNAPACTEVEQERNTSNSSTTANKNNVELRLIARPPYSIVARTYDTADTVGDFAKLPARVSNTSAFFTRLVEANPDYLLDAVASAMNELDAIIREDPSLKPFVDQAKAVNKVEREELKARSRRRRALQQASSSSSHSIPISAQPSAAASGHAADPKVDHMPVSSTSSGSSDFGKRRTSPPVDRAPSSAGAHNTHVSSSGISPSGQPNVPRSSSLSSSPAARSTPTASRRPRHGRLDTRRPGHQSKKKKVEWPEHSVLAHSSPDMFAFYQASDGQNAYLHPLCHRIFLAEFEGRFPDAPETLTVPILEIERHTMNEDLRRRYRFLGHLPLGCEFVFVEVDMAAVVSEESIEKYATQIDQRKAGRRDRAIAAAREDRRVAALTNKSFQEHFNLAEHRRLGGQDVQVVDGSDITSFPPILSRGSSDAQTAVEASTGAGASVTEGSASTAEASAAEELNPERQAPRGEFRPTWGPSVSSYSAATRSMGVFPDLSATLPLRPVMPAPPPTHGRWHGDASNAGVPTSPRTESHPLRPAPSSSPREVTVPATSDAGPSRAWGQASLVHGERCGAAPTVDDPAESPTSQGHGRRTGGSGGGSRRSRRPTVMVMSNAGAQGRR